MGNVLIASDGIVKVSSAGEKGRGIERLRGERGGTGGPESTLGRR